MLGDNVTMELILQGLTKRTHAEVLREMFADNVERAILSVAFLSEDGIELIEPQLQKLAARVTVFAGIRNEITSAQALRRLFSLGISLYAVDTGSSALLFHPKLYYVRTADAAKLCVGSANLTLGGLNNNVEAGLSIRLSLANVADFKSVKELEDLFNGLSADHPANVFRIDNVGVIDGLLNAGRLVDEAILSPTRVATSAKAGSSDPTPRMKMLPKPLVGKPKGGRTGAAAVTPAPAGPAGPARSPTFQPEFELVWESKPLTRRSLGIPTGPNSNPTGSMILGSGTFKDIDRVTYFRNELFGHLPWTLNSGIETADQAFDLVIKGIFVGTFQLTLRHSRTRVAAAPEDHNSPSNLSWNDARLLVAREDLLDRTMRIWRSTADPFKFRIEID